MRLLVSVRSGVEAAAAIQGGCDLLDVKEPSRGSLGAADPGVVAEVCASAGGSIPVSVALGELAEWDDVREIPAFPAEVALAKLGLGGCGSYPGWARRWRRLRERFDEAAGRRVGWIAVAYADPAADGPDAYPLIDLAATTGCRGVLVDTFRKDAGRLFDHVTPDRLAGWRRAAEAAGLTFAVAGSLRIDDLPRLEGMRPDVVAVRGAACGGADRTGDVCAGAVRRFRAALVETFGAEPGPLAGAAG